MTLRDREMVEVSAPAVVSAQDSANDTFAVASDETHFWIAFQIERDVRPGVGFVETDAFGSAP